MPKILDKAVKAIRKSGVSAKRAWPIAVSTLQKSGSLKKGSLTATKKGVKRGSMSKAARARSR